jgi:hypothetical protein
LTLRKQLIAMTSVATCGLLALAAPAAAQGFGQVAVGTTAAPPATPAPDAAKPAGHEVEGVTVTGKRIPESQRDPTEVLCHEEVTLGSRFPQKICATRRQFTERRQLDQEQLYEWTQGKPLKGN